MTKEKKRKELKLEFLSELERREAELLSWGVVDGFFPEDELLKLIAGYLAENDPDSVYDDEDDLLEVLREDALIFELPGGDLRYRSRMAEGIRLLFRLRQILHWRAWDKAQNLIADYRLLLRPRRYPRRHLAPKMVHTRLEPVLDGSAVERQIVDTLIGAKRPTPLDLADFQVNAARRVLEEVRKKRKSGTIVCAGTGSGKTLAFYLPALVALARWSDKERWTRCLSLYPRNELLKDQLSTAVKRVREVNAVLEAAGRRPLQVGAMFGAVPNTAANPGDSFFDQWEQMGAARLCPFLACPSCDQVALIWRDDDRSAGHEVLVCSRCKVKVGPELFALTRNSMHANPPDLLFTSLEMVNQRMSDPKLGKLLGLGQPRHKLPRLVLLDEVHTYEGVYGAQAALLIRRWKHLSAAAPHFVGLSATLADARRFFADFLNEREELIEEVSPREEDLVGQGQEYMLAVRGDPISNTNLLSASIQVAMLLRRILDARPEPNRQPDGVFGTKVFGFTDNLDVINRLYHNLLDAEGWVLDRDASPVRKSPNERNASISEPWLAAYRATNRPDHSTRWALGQSWDLSDRIGHRLTGDEPPVRVARTSSQDVGVDAQADVVIATASLEVGYDDPSVGAVFQHKAPMSAAAFIQRKGRAGRQRDMRPWTVVVLSCYGRDRIAYEGYEQLFSPELQPRHLPMSNRYVLRIQATYALMDWLCRDGGDGHVWQLLAQPPTKDFEQYSKPRQKQIRELAERLLTDMVQQCRLHAHLRYALNVDEATVLSLLWDPPRSLMMAVLPTIVRRLDRGWKQAVRPGAKEQVEPNRFWSPLPEFVPSNLFSDLNLPEVQVHLEGRKEPESMGVRQALQEFAPGRVTLRFGVSSRHGRYWIPVSPGQTAVLLDEVCPISAREELGSWSFENENGIESVRVVRPLALCVKRPPAEVSSSSNARLRWATQILPPPETSVVGVPKGSPWSNIVEGFVFYMHAHANPIEVRRFAVGADFSVKRSQDQDFEGSCRFNDSASANLPRQPVALGYTVDADGVCFSVSVPKALHQRLEGDATLLHGTRPAYFRHRLNAHEALNQISNLFQREWLARIYLGAVVLEAERVRGSLRDGHQEILDRNLAPLHEVLDVIFRSLGNEDAGDGNTRRAQLLAIMTEPGFRLALEDCAPVLWQRPDDTWEAWLTHRYCATLAIALREAAQQLCPELEAEDLYADIDPGVRGGVRVEQTELWLTETTVGGGGVVEALHHSYTEDPRRFFELLDAALAPTDFETMHSELVLLLGWLHEDSERGLAMRRAFTRVRAARSHRELLETHLDLRQTLSGDGFRTSHSIMTALHARVLRPGSSPATDKLLYKLMQRWETTEDRLGIEVDGHVYAYLCSDSEELDQALCGLGLELGNTAPAQWRFDTLYSLLWPRGAAVRAQGLQAYNPYQPLPETDRLLVLHTQARKHKQIALGSPQWMQSLRETLAEEGMATLTASLDQRHRLAEAIRSLLVEPVDLGFIMGFPRVRGLTQDGRQLSLIVEIPEVTQ
jgi:hypothetical protein